MRQLKIIRQVTNRDLPSLDKYLQEIGRESMVNPNEEVILHVGFKEGDQERDEQIDLGQSSICCIR